MEIRDTGRRWATRAIRGATTVSENTATAILEGTVEMVTEIIKQNELDTNEIVSIIFTTTVDLDAAFPAMAARKIGLTNIPLICASEIPVPGSQERCVRCMMHVNSLLTQEEIRHVYLHDARNLRPDLQAKSE